MPSDRKKLFLEGPIGTALIRLAIPIILGNVLQTGYQLTDAFWVGRLGAAAVAAVSVSFPVTFLVIALGAGLGIAGATLSAQYMGAGRQDMVNHVAAQTMMMVTSPRSCLGAAGYVLAPYLLDLLGVAPDVYARRARFHARLLRRHHLRLPLRHVSGVDARRRRNPDSAYDRARHRDSEFSLDPLFIFGLGPLPPQGVMGAALATLATQALAAVLGIIIFLRGRHGIQLSWRGFFPDPAYIKRAFFLGLPGSVEFSTRGPGSDADVLSGGEFRHCDDRGLWCRLEHPAVRHDPGDGHVDGGFDAGQPEYGRRQLAARGTHDASRHRSSFGILTVVGFVAYIFAPPLVAFFVPHDADVIAEGAQFIRIMCLAWGGIGMQLCIVSAFRASGNMLMAMVIALVSQFMMQFPLAYILSKHTSLQAAGLWWSFPITTSLSRSSRWAGSRKAAGKRRC